MVDAMRLERRRLRHEQRVGAALADDAGDDDAGDNSAGVSAGPPDLPAGREARWGAQGAAVEGQEEEACQCGTNPFAEAGAELTVIDGKLAALLGTGAGGGGGGEWYAPRWVRRQWVAGPKRGGDAGLMHTIPRPVQGLRRAAAAAAAAGAGAQHGAAAAAHRCGLAGAAHRCSHALQRRQWWRKPVVNVSVDAIYTFEAFLASPAVQSTTRRGEWGMGTGPAIKVHARRQRGNLECMDEVRRCLAASDGCGAVGAAAAAAAAAAATWGSVRAPHKHTHTFLPWILRR